MPSLSASNHLPYTNPPEDPQLALECGIERLRDTQAQGPYDWPAGIDYASVKVPDAQIEEDHDARLEVLDLLDDE